jgi:hypothetical protein
VIPEALPVPSLPNPCDVSTITATVCTGAKAVVNGGKALVHAPAAAQHVVQDVGTAVDWARDPGAAMAKAAAAEWQGLEKLITSTSSLSFGNSAFLTQYEAMAGLGVVLTGLVYLLVFLRGRRDMAPSEVGGHLLAAVAVCLLAPGFADVFAYLSNGLLTAVQGGQDGDLGRYLAGVAHALGTASGSSFRGGTLALLFASFVELVLGFALWVFMEVRQVLCYGAVWVGPLFAALLVGGPRLHKPVMQWGCYCLAVIFSPFLVFGVIRLGIGLLSTGQSGDAYSSMLAGAALLLVADALFAVLLSLVPSMADRLAAGTSQAVGGARSRVDPVSTIRSGAAMGTSVHAVTAGGGKAGIGMGPVPAYGGGSGGGASAPRGSAAAPAHAATAAAPLAQPGAAGGVQAAAGHPEADRRGRSPRPSGPGSRP